MTPFCRLLDPSTYRASPWDMAQDPAARAYFTRFFRAQYDRTLKLAVAQAMLDGANQSDARRRARHCRAEFFSYLDKLELPTLPFHRITILAIDAIRDGLLRAAGFADPYLHQKQTQNAAAIPSLPGICRDLDSLPPDQRLEPAVRGALAGNIFDMGVAATAERMLGRDLEFLHTRDSLPPRPWLADGLDLLAAGMLQKPYRKAIVFVDNAGADFVLGMIPLCRMLAQSGTSVVIACNRLATLNDMTITDVQSLWPALIAAEPSLATLPITAIATGTAEPLIDLLKVSDELNQAAADADLVILEGMGRALESNYDARFNCDVLKIAMIKDAFVATWVGGNVYDVVCRFDAVQS